MKSQVEYWKNKVNENLDHREKKINEWKTKIIC